MTLHLRSLLLLLVLAPRPAETQTSPPLPAPSELNSLEDTVAQAVDGTRDAAHLRRLARLPARRSLRQIVCSSSYQQRPRTELITAESEADSAILSLNPAVLASASVTLPPDLRRVAVYDDRRTARGRRVTRFSVAAFRSPFDPNLAWVGVALYWSHFTEYFSIHLTRSYFPLDLAGPIPDGAIAVPCTTLP